MTALRLFMCHLIKLGCVAWAMGGMASALKANDIKTIGIEVDPISMLILNLLPVTSGGAGAVDLRVSEHFSLRTAYSQMGIDLDSEEIRKEMDELDSDSKFSIRRIRFQQVQQMVMLYSRPLAGWYGGLGASYSQSTIQVEHRTSRGMVDINATGFATTAVAGYKAQWNNGVYLRFGVRGQYANSSRIRVQERDSFDEAAQKDIDDYTDEMSGYKTAAVSNGGLDFLIGLAF